MSVTDDDLILEGEELAAEGPCIEAGVGRVVVPAKGKLFADDGSVNVAIIRPCMSRGKRLRGLAPIYEAAMLGRNDSVFEDWHMWMGHMSVPLKEALEELEEQLQEAVTPRRLFSELGGRVTKTWFDPHFRAKRDEENGYQPGATMGRVIPYPAARQILEADPDGLHVSIAAWPTGARRASPSWDKGATGMAIEGFRRTPRGSVDWVLRGGAGGRPVTDGLTEAEAAAVCSLGELYASAMPESPFKDITLEQLQERVRKENPALAKSMGLEESAAPPATPPAPVSAAAPAASLTQADLDRALSEQRRTLTEEFTSKLTEAEDDQDQAIEEALAEARSVSTNEDVARRMVQKSGLPSRWQDDILRRYTSTAAGVPDALLTESFTDTEGKTHTPAEVFQARVEEDIKHARTLIEEVGGAPRVSGLGGSGSKGSQGAKRSRTQGAFRDFLRESGDDLGDTDEKVQESIKNMVQEGIS